MRIIFCDGDDASIAITVPRFFFLVCCLTFDDVLVLLIGGRTMVHCSSSWEYCSILESIRPLIMGGSRASKKQHVRITKSKRIASLLCFIPWIVWADDKKAKLVLPGCSRWFEDAISSRPWSALQGRLLVLVLPLCRNIALLYFHSILYTCVGLWSLVPVSCLANEQRRGLSEKKELSATCTCNLWLVCRK